MKYILIRKKDLKLFNCIKREYEKNTFYLEDSSHNYLVKGEYFFDLELNKLCQHNGSQRLLYTAQGKKRIIATDRNDSNYKQLPQLNEFTIYEEKQEKNEI